jgi:lipopolysaccharide assembly protein A
VKILRTIVWVLAAIGFLIFAAYNWNRIELKLWQNLVIDTPMPMVALLAFAAGFLPMWAVHRSTTWGLNRRIRTLENSLKTTAMAHRADLTGTAVHTTPADRAVDKSGTSEGEPAGVFSPADVSSNGGSGK